MRCGLLSFDSRSGFGVKDQKRSAWQDACTYINIGLDKKTEYWNMDFRLINCGMVSVWLGQYFVFPCQCFYNPISGIAGALVCERVRMGPYIYDQQILEFVRKWSVVQCVLQ